MCSGLWFLWCVIRTFRDAPALCWDGVGLDGVGLWALGRVGVGWVGAAWIGLGQVGYGRLCGLDWVVVGRGGVLWYVLEQG